MRKGGFRRLPVVKDGQLVGIITDRDLREYLGLLERTKVSAAMSENLMTVAPRTTFEQAAKRHRSETDHRFRKGGVKEFGLARPDYKHGQIPAVRSWNRNRAAFVAEAGQLYGNPAKPTRSQALRCVTKNCGD